MNFKNYYETVQKTFKFRIKSVYELDAASMDVIDRVLQKYRPSKVGHPKKMMFQTNPLGFVGAKNVELYFFDVELTVPASPAILQNDLRTSFGLSGDSDLIQVFSDCEDVEPVEEKADDTDKEALLCQSNYEEAEAVDPEEHFGDAYNRRFLDYVKEVEKKRDLNKKIDAPHPITKWEKQPDPSAADPKQDETNFNAHLKTDAPAKFETRETPKNLKEKK